MRKCSRISLILVLLLVAVCGYTRTWYVNASAAGPGDGSYANPFLTIVEAVDAAAEGDTIRVAAGTYRGHLRLKNRLRIYGGVGGPESVIVRRAALDGYSLIKAEGVTGVVIKDISINGGYAGQGAGVYMIGSSVTFDNCVFTRNVTSSTGHDHEHGGAIYATVSTPTIRDCRFIGNIAGIGNGGAIYLDDCDGSILNSVFESNTAFKGSGGAIYAKESTTTITSCVMRENISKNGGGVCADDSDLVIDGCVFQANRADSLGAPESFPFGGGVTLYGSECDTLVRKCRFVENYSSDKGGGMYIFAADNLTIDCVFERNTTGFDGEGGGVCAFHADFFGHPIPEPMFKNCTFNANSSANGSAIYNEGPRSRIINCTVFGNTLRLESGDPVLTGSTAGIYNTTGTAGILVLNTIVWGNEGTAQVKNGGAGVTTVRYCDIEGGYPGIGNINVDPLFRNATAGDFHLSNNLFTGTYSPCIDAGSPAFDPDFGLLPTHDFEGDLRVRDGDRRAGSVVDMGIDEAPPRRLLFLSDFEGPSSMTGTAGSTVVATYRCHLTLEDWAPGISGYKCSFGVKNAALSGIVLKGTDAGTLIEKGLATGTVSLIQGGAMTTFATTNGSLKLEPGKPFATAIITISVKIPDKPAAITLSLAGNGASTGVFENGTSLPLETSEKVITVAPGATLVQ